MNIDLTTMTAAPIPIIDAVMEGQKNFVHSNFFNWGDQQYAADFVQLWDVNQDLSRPPLPNLRNLVIYQSAQFNIESLPRWEGLVERVDAFRWSHMYAVPARAAGIGDGGFDIFRSLERVPTLIPGNMLQNIFINTRAHFGDKKHGKNVRKAAKIHAHQITTAGGSQQDGLTARKTMLKNTLEQTMNVWRQ